MALGWIFDGFWGQVGGQVGAKLAPKSEEMGYQDDVKKSSKIWRRGGRQVVRRWYAGVPRVNLVLAPNSTTVLEY